MAKSGCIYGDSGTFKTTAVAHFAHYIAEATGKATLLFSSDGGGWSACDAEIEAGMIRPFRCDTGLPLPILRRVSQGYWPENPTEPDITKMNFTKVNWDEVGGIAVEGLTSISTMIMRHLADKAIKTGEDATSQFSQSLLVDGTVISEKFAGNSKGHYNFMHRVLYGTVMNFISLPVAYVLFTALEKRAEDDDRTLIYGPATEGKASTPHIPSWVGDCIHAEAASVKRIVKGPNPANPKEMIDTEISDTVCRYWFRKHPDARTSVMYPAKPRVVPAKVEALNAAYPGGFFIPTPTAGFDTYLHKIDELKLDSADSLKGWRERLDAKLGRKPQQQAVATK